jgi:mRNA interferase RelE/StbE
VPYRVEVAPAAGRDLRRLPEPIRDRVEAAIRTLAEGPRPPGSKKITGRERSYRIRVGTLRVIYETFDDERLVVIARVLRRTETTYRRLR